MAKENWDILLDTDNDDLVKNGDFAIGDGIGDDCKIILGLTTGALKSDPILGPNLVSMMNSKRPPDDIVKAIRVNLKRDNKAPTKVEIKNGSIDIKF